MKKYRYNHKTMTYEEKEVPRILNVLRILTILVLLAALEFGYAWIYRNVLKWDLPKTAILKNEKARWEGRVKVMQRQMDLYETTLAGIEARDNLIYRSIFGMDSIVVSSGDTVSDLVSKIERLEERVAARSFSLDSVALVASTAGDMISHVPAVPPICPVRGRFRISSAFGRRVDPVSGRGAFHEGMDFAAKKGTPVYCTADGVVESVKYSSKGYGNELMVNHGFGYKTRYAHLMTTTVTEGMKLRRGDIVGTVGNSGKSTGPHLHYEVIYMHGKKNPYNFMDLEMSDTEFRSMTASRAGDSPYQGTMSTTGELLRRRK